jgi:hypothetical protein
VVLSSLRTLLYNVRYTVHVILILVYPSFVMHVIRGGGTLLEDKMSNQEETVQHFKKCLLTN